MTNYFVSQRPILTEIAAINTYKLLVHPPLLGGIFFVNNIYAHSFYDETYLDNSEALLVLSQSLSGILKSLQLKNINPNPKASPTRLGEILISSSSI